MSVASKLKLIKKLEEKEYRDAYCEEHVKTGISYQVRALRGQRSLSQLALAKLSSTKQTAISRIEDPDYGNLNINTLLKLASAFDVALLVKFVPFSRFLEEIKDVSENSLRVDSFKREAVTITASAMLEENPIFEINRTNTNTFWIDYYKGCLDNYSVSKMVSEEVIITTKAGDHTSAESHVLVPFKTMSLEVNTIK